MFQQKIISYLKKKSFEPERNLEEVDLLLDPILQAVNGENEKIDKVIEELIEKSEILANVQAMAQVDNTKNTDNEQDSKTCRMCKSSRSNERFEALFDDDGHKAKMLKMISGIDISYDEEKRSKFICHDCLQRLRQACIVRQEIRISEIYFATKQKISLEKKHCEEISETSSENHKPNNCHVDQIEDNKNHSSLNKSRYSKCSHCSEILVTQYLRYHIKAVHEKVRNYHCKICQYSSYGISEWKRHLAAHKKNPNYKLRASCSYTQDETCHFKCAVADCGKTFTKKRSLQMHKFVHDDTRSFMCPCGQSFKHKRNMYRHRSVRSH